MAITPLLPAPVPHDDAPATLVRVIMHRHEADQAAVAEMVAVLDYADAHRLEAEELLDAGALGGEWRGAYGYGFIGTLREAGVEGAERKLRLAGEGAFYVAEFAVCEIAAALKMSETSARRCVGQLIELRERLPRLYEEVVAGVVPVWKARQVAQDTIPLNPAAAEYVDRHLARFAHKLSLWRLEKVVQAAMLRHDPELAKERARKARDKRGVWVDDTLDGVSTIQATVDTPDAAAFELAVAGVATTLGELGAADDLDARRAKAVGVLADPQYALDLASTADAAAAGAEAPVRPSRRRSGKGGVGGGPVIHVHLHTAATEGFKSGVGPVARVDGYGPRSVEAVEGWLADLAPGVKINLTPVVDLNDYLQVDAYEAPVPIRNQVQERDLCCAFPWCGRAGVFDLDHIREYLPLDEGGSPGQTNTLNLGRLCRFHHRVKTHSAWRYQRQRDHSLLWHSPMGRSYRVDGTGTTSYD